MDIQEVKFFKGIDSNVIKEIEEGCSSAMFKQGDTIFKKGDSADFLYILEQGDINLVLKDKDVTFCRLNQAGEVFGWSSIVEKGIYTSSCICKAPTSVLRIQKDKIEAIFDTFPKAAITFYRRLGSIFSKRISKAIE